MVSESWRNNLYAIAVAEFVVLIGFNFVNPFMPLFIQELGNYTNSEAAFWAGIATGSSGVAMFFSAPLWGIVADRWGRKPMVLRAMFGSAVVLALVGLATDVFYLVALRFAQGLLSGTVAAASALVAATTPRGKIPFAMGLLMVAVFGGQSLGPLLGGFMADSVGYRTAFFITSALVLSGGLIVLLLVKENFERPVQGQSASLVSVWRLAASRQMLPLLLAFFTLHAGPQMITPVIPLLIKELDPRGATATVSGVAFGLMGVVAAISSLVTARLVRRISLKKILVLSCIGAGLLYLPPMWAVAVAPLVVFIALTGLFKGGIMTSSNVLIGLSTSPNQQGVAYGVAQSASALGGGLGPLIGGSLAPLLGLKPVFGVTGGFFILVGILVTKLLVERSLNRS